MSKLYLDTGILVWNGNGTSGNDQIQKFLMELPTTDHTLNTLDAQPIIGKATTFIINQEISLLNFDRKLNFWKKFTWIGIE